MIVIGIISAASYEFALVLLFALIIVEAIGLISITVRRLHDTGRSGAWAWFWLLPFVGWAIVIFMLVQPSNPNTPYIGRPRIHPPVR